tara:strand:+ start:357 stop:608 length:252 start_codon:yes stop_codon:yes gene_type:complete
MMEESKVIEVLEVLLGLVIYDHLSCDIDSDEFCRFIEEPGAWQIGYQHGAIRQARQIITEAKDTKQNFCDDCGSSQVSYAKIH